MSKKYHNTFYEGDFYHIYNRGINNEILYKSKRNYLFFLERWKKYVGEILEVYCYCLLPTHFHFFVRVVDSFTKLKKFRKAKDINKILEHQFMLLFRSYALAFNKENSRTGSLFQKGFKRIRIDNEQYFTAIIHYIPNAAQDCKQIYLSRKAAKLAKCNFLFFLAFFASRKKLLFSFI